MLCEEGSVEARWRDLREGARLGFQTGAEVAPPPRFRRKKKRSDRSFLVKFSVVALWCKAIRVAVLNGGSAPDKGRDKVSSRLADRNVL